MNAIAMAVACAIVGVDAGYQPIDGGGVEYIIQIEPHLLPILLDGQQITSNVPRDLDVRRYRITVGTAKVPRENPVPRQVPGHGDAGPQPHRATRPVSEDAPQDAGISPDENGLQVAFQPSAAGGDYIVSIRPKLLDQLLEGNDLSGDLPSGLEVSRFCATTAPLGQPLAKAGGRPVVDDSWRHDPIDDLAAGASGDVDNRTESVIEPLNESTEMVDPVPLPDKRHLLPGDPFAHEPTADPFRPDYEAVDRAKRGPETDLRTAESSGSASTGKTAGQMPRSEVPARFKPDPRSERLAERASFDDAGQPLEPFPKREQSAAHSAAAQIAPAHTPNGTAASAGKSEAHGRPAASESRPWLPLTLTLLLLCGSIGANVFLGWVAWGARQQCRELLDRLRTAPVSN